MVQRFNNCSVRYSGCRFACGKSTVRALPPRPREAPTVLESLGVNTAAPPEIVERCLNEHGICFIFAPLSIVLPLVSRRCAGI